MSKWAHLLRKRWQKILQKTKKSWNFCHDFTTCDTNLTIKNIFSWNIYIWVIWLEMIQNSLKKWKKYRIFRLRFTTFDMISTPKFKDFTKILLMGNLYKNDGKSLKVSFQSFPKKAIKITIVNTKSIVLTTVNSY